MLWLQRFKSNRVLSGCTEFNRIWCLKGGLRSALGNYAGDTGSEFLLRAMQKPDWDLRSTSFEAPVQSHFSAENPTQLEWNKQKHHNFPQCRFEMVPNGSKWFEIRANYKDVISALNTMSYFNLQNIRYDKNGRSEQRCCQVAWSLGSSRRHMYNLDVLGKMRWKSWPMWNHAIEMETNKKHHLHDVLRNLGHADGSAWHILLKACKVATGFDEAVWNGRKRRGAE